MRRYLFSKSSLQNNSKKFDVIIVGAGLAGLYCALCIDPDKSVAVVTKGSYESGSSWLAQGGIAAVTKSDDKIEDHIQNTLVAGAGHCDIDAVNVLVTEGPSDIQKLIEYGVPFDKDENGEIIVTREGGHNRSRILHCGGDATGRLMTSTLYDVVSKRKNITVLFDTTLVDILTDKEGACGIVVNSNQQNRVLRSGNIVISTGSVGQLYRDTTNPKGSTGDGIAACVRAGAKTKDMEFVQFHPTALAVGEEDSRMFLISEAVRGEGAILENSKGEPFMYNKHSLRDLAPRDIVTREILRELERTGDDTAYLNVSCMDEQFFARRFPTIFQRCRKLGINVPYERIPVRPTQHYHMGGVQTDLDAKTSVDGLYACGEVACTGVQGANRLASNSTLECLVFARRAAQKINKDFRNNSDCSVENIVIEEYSAPCPKSAQILSDIECMKLIMTNNVGAVRKQENMKKALERLYAIRDTYKNCVLETPLQYLVMNAVTTSIIITESALARPKSLGSHYVVR